MKEMPSMYNLNFIPQRGCASPLAVVTFYNIPPFICLNHCDDTGAITNRDIPVATGHPPTICAQNPPDQVHHQNKPGDSIPGRPAHASVMTNERWGL